jgi:hypothetical protein
MSITNNTKTPKDCSLIDLVRRAVEKHFSHVLDIDSLTKGEGLTVGCRTIISDYVCIRLIDNSDPRAFLKINSVFIEYPELGGAVEAGQGPNPFQNYGELKKAIRNGVMQIRTNQWAENNTNIVNGYNMNL